MNIVQCKNDQSILSIDNQGYLFTEAIINKNSPCFLNYKLIPDKKYVFRVKIKMINPNS